MSLLQDPFYVVKDEVQQSVGGITALYDRWHELIKTPQTTMAHVDELKWTTNQLRTGINSIERDILDLEETIGIVENNRQKFRLDQAELDSRKKFISEIKYVLKKMKDELQSVTAKGKITNNERGALMKNTSNGKYAALDRVIQEDNEAFIRNQQQVQEQIIKEQDTELEQISQTVDTMKRILLFKINNINITKCGEKRKFLVFRFFNNFFDSPHRYGRCDICRIKLTK
eukprot:Phypoly_transcript_14747.p1 GENE.Phypoly_transcript_14747~~Phypoly_transcript_14747.p1  ORF type:complete len:229 (+),score=29.74 Phypoly_transcript_14747:86-772(+)